MTKTEDDARAVLPLWGIADECTVSRTDTGTMNDTFRVETEPASFALRCHRRLTRTSVAFEHRVMVSVAARGVPVPLVVPSLSGDECVELDGRLWSLATWLRGDHVPRSELRPRHGGGMGVMLGHVHNALGDLDAPIDKPAQAEAADVTLHRIDRLVAHISAREQRGSDEQLAVAWLSAQADWIDRHRNSPDAPDRGSNQLLHGDYHDANVLFDSSEVVAVLDWDKAEYGDPAREVLRTMHLSFDLGAECSRAFVAEYRTKRELSMEALDVAAVHYGFDRDRSLWFFEELYLGGNERLRPLINRLPFVPFEQLWAIARRVVS